MPPSLLDLVKNFKDDEAGCSDGSTDSDDDDYSGSETGEEVSDDGKSSGDSSSEEETEEDSDEPAGSKEEAEPDDDDDDDDDKPINIKPKARPAASKPEATPDGDSSSSDGEDTMDTDFSAVKEKAKESVKKATAPKPKKAVPERRVVSDDSFAGPAPSPSTFPCGIQTGQLATNKLAKILEESGVVPGHTEFPTTVTVRWITANPGKAVIYAPSGPKGYILVPNKAGTKIDARAIKPADWIDTIDVGTADDLSVTPEFFSLRPKPRKRKQDAPTSAKPTSTATGSPEASPSAASIQGAFKRAKVTSDKPKEAETKTADGPKTTNEAATSAGAATRESNKQQDVAASATAKTGQASPSPVPMSTDHKGLGAASRESSTSSRPSITIVETPDTGATNTRGAKDATNTRGAGGPAPVSGTASGGARQPPVKFSPEIIRGPNGVGGWAPNLTDNNGVVIVFYETPSAS
ncbi:MAG: hypothetical protein ACPGR8_10435, partial [Limisphaerales bacterium]